MLCLVVLKKVFTSNYTLHPNMHGNAHLNPHPTESNALHTDDIHQEMQIPKYMQFLMLQLKYKPTFVHVNG